MFSIRLIVYFEREVHKYITAFLTNFSCFSVSVGGRQVCRPHFPHHSSLHPWLSNSSSDTKPLQHQNSSWFTGSSTEESSLKSSPNPQQNPATSSASSHPMFSYPPTPPKTHPTPPTPDSVTAASTNVTVTSSSASNEYTNAIAHAASMGVFLHPDQSSCDIKPMLNSGSKQREGTNSSSGTASPGSASSYQPYQDSYSYSSYPSYNYSKHGAASPTEHFSKSSPTSSRNKARTSAGKISDNLSQPGTGLSFTSLLFIFVHL